MNALASWFGATSALDTGQLIGLFGHFLSLSLVAIGGAMAAAPDMQRYIVAEQHWISEAQFTASVALAQAAPGPNVLFVAVIGWNVAGGWGALAALTGVLLPSSLLTLGLARWGRSRRENRGVRAFHDGMAPLSIGLLLATGWILAAPAVVGPGSLALVGLTTLVSVWRSISPLWLIAGGALVGGLGYA